jgi:hypothetical protein
VWASAIIRARATQYGDAVRVMQVQGARLDWAYLERWAATLITRARAGQPFRD